MVMCMVNGKMRDIGELYDPDAPNKEIKRTAHKCLVSRMDDRLTMSLMYNPERKMYYILFNIVISSKASEETRISIDDMLDMYDLWLNVDLVPSNVTSLEHYADDYEIPVKYIDSLCTWWDEFGNDAYNDAVCRS